MPVSKGVSSWVSAHVSEVKTCQDLVLGFSGGPGLGLLLPCDQQPAFAHVSRIASHFFSRFLKFPVASWSWDCLVASTCQWGSDHVRTTGRCPSTHISKFHKVKRFHSSSTMLYSLQPMSSWRDSACDDSPWIVHREGVHWCLCSMLHGMLFCSHEKSWELWMFFPPAICYEHVWNIALDPSPKWVSSGVIKHGWLENPPFIIMKIIVYRWVSQ